MPGAAEAIRMLLSALSPGQGLGGVISGRESILPCFPRLQLQERKRISVLSKDYTPDTRARGRSIAAADGSLSADVLTIRPGSTGKLG